VGWRAWGDRPTALSRTAVARRGGKHLHSPPAHNPRVKKKKKKKKKMSGVLDGARHVTGADPRS
jgi:hypothetical protein